MDPDPRVELRNKIAEKIAVGMHSLLESVYGYDMVQPCGHATERDVQDAADAVMELFPSVGYTTQLGLVEHVPTGRCITAHTTVEYLADLIMREISDGS